MRNNEEKFPLLRPKEMKTTLHHIFHIDHLIVSALTIAVIGLLVLITVNVEFLNPVVRAVESFQMTDVYYRIMHTGETEVNSQITLVDITKLTSRDRDKIASVVREISEIGPTALGVDVIFEGLKGNPDADEELMDAFFGAPANTVLAYKLTEPDEQTGSFNNAVHSFFAPITGQTEGTVNVINNPHRSMNNYPMYFILGKDTVRSITAQLASMLGVEVDPELKEHVINYRGTEFPVVEYNELQQHRDLIANHIVFLGSTREEADKHLTPFGQRPGMEILAYSLLSMIEGAHVYRAPFWQILIWALIAGYLTNVLDYFISSALGRRKSTLMVFITESEFYDKLICFAIMTTLTFITFMLFVKLDYYVDTVLALSTIVFIEEGRLIYVGLLAALKKKFGWKGVERSLYADDLREVVPQKEEKSETKLLIKK